VRTDRGHSLDFIESAKRDAARSKEILATVLADLNEHNRWFEAYSSEEKKKRERHARLLRRHHVTLVRQERHELRVEAVKGSSRQAAARTRASIMSHWDGLVGEVVALKDAFWTSADWTRRGLTDLGSGAHRLSSTALSGIGAKSGSFGKVTAAAVSAASERVARTASASAAWTATKGRAVAGASASALSAASSRLAEGRQAMSAAAGRAVSRPSEDGEGVSLPAAAGSSALSAGLARTRQVLASAAEKAAASLARSGAAARSLASTGTKSLSGSTKRGGETAQRRLGAAISTGSAGSLAFLRERGKAAGSGLAAATSGVRSKAKELSGSVAPRLAAAKAAASAAAQTSAKKASEGLAGASSRIGKATEGARAKLKTTAPALHKKYDDAVQGVRSAVATQWTAAKPMVDKWRHRASDLVSPEQLEKLRAAAAETIARRTAGTKAEAIGAKLLDQLKPAGAALAAAGGTAQKALLKEPIGAAGPSGRNTALVVYRPEIAKLLSDLSERERNRG
jgi:hypothetical protein